MTSKDNKDKLVRGRGTCKVQMTNFNKFLNTIESKTSLSDVEICEIESRLNKIEHVFEKFENFQSELELIATDEELDSVIEERNIFEDNYFKLSAKAKALMQKFSPEDDLHSIVGSQARSHGSATRVNGSGEGGVKLPVISLPKFSGDYKTWLEFRDIFGNLIHDNESLSPIQKFHYLRASLYDAAADVIRSLDFCDSNYSIAWTTLCERYNNKRLLVHMHLKNLFDLEPIQKESAEKLRFMIDSVSKNLNALTSLNQDTDHWGTLIMYLVSTKLDRVTDREWEEFKNTKTDILSWLDLKEFLKSRADLLETLQRKNNSENHTERHDLYKNRDKGQGHRDKNKFGTRGLLSHEIKCVMCKGEHLIVNCEQFTRLPQNERFDKAKQLKLCLNCLKPGHYSKSCRFSPCSKCRARHNSLLHYDVAKSANNSENQTAQNQDTQVALSSLNSDNHVFLSTVLLEVQDSSGAWHVVRALLDSGSQSSFMTLELCNKLKLNKERFNLTIGGLAQSCSEVQYRSKICIKSLHNSYSTNLNCLILPHITGQVPSVKIDVSKLNIPKNIRLADPSYFKPNQIDLLIGNELFYTLLCVGQISLGKGNPVLQKTRFGWIVSGPLQVQTLSKMLCHFSANTSKQNIGINLEKFWDIEHEFANERKPRSIEENECEYNFQKTYKRDNEGRFIVSMPLKESAECLGNSKENALRRFLSLERKFEANPEFKNKYCKFMSEYFELGHMSEVEELNDNMLSYYMPHHGVIKKDSLTTKCRVVFDCSMPTTSGKSLNDIQLVGPVLQPHLFDILFRFREYRYVISADIAKMYRQVLIEPNQRCLQRILWRDTPSQRIKNFDLNTVTYGQACASFLAVRCIMQLAKECKESLPDISKLIETCFYVDDFLCSVDSIDMGIYIVENVSKVLERGCFNLRKWTSNEPQILFNVGDQNDELKILEFGQSENTKTLGLTWSCSSDTLTYKVGTPNESDRLTKRSVLSYIAQVFDPLGLISPCIIIAKILLQKLWLEKLGWDQALPMELHDIWSKFLRELPIVNELKIPRQVTCMNAMSCELHGFSDASDSAYGAAIYIKSCDNQGNFVVRLLCAKSKVSPLKPLTIPRLEICGALILARLVDKVLNSLTLSIIRSILWTDSTIVLGWLKTPPNLLKTFVASRVSEIQTLTKNCEWRHIPSKDNPADIVSRGVFPSQILNLELWWKGPLFLGQNEDCWPQSAAITGIVPELRPNKKLFSLSSIEFNTFIFDKFSSYKRLIRVVAWILRFIKSCQNKVSRKTDKIFRGPLSLHELNLSEMYLIRMSQMECFPKEYSCLKENQILNSKNNLLSLNPFMDEFGILRVGGRLRNSNFSFNKKHPMLISSKHRFAKLICENEHQRLMHAGPQLLLSSLRERYWLISARNLARATVRNCLKCFRFRVRVTEPIMGDLPENRIASGKVFDIVGVDYMGPLTIRDRKVRGAKLSKCYVSLFVCFTTKALHLEVVSDLTSEAFILAFRRFIARRGKPSHVYSDNGLNFIGADRELRELGNYLQENVDYFYDMYSKEGVQWHFIPAHSPHFGGLWEAGVKSSKHHLKRVAGNASLTFEELTTLLAQIESILNSRPLTPLSSDPNDYYPLTPAHFLIGKNLTTLPDPDLSHVPESRLSIYQKIQQLKQHFWARWSKEYIAELQQRVKWKQSQSDVQLGSLVLLKEDNAPPLKWRLGRIVCVYPGKDKINRVADIKTANGVVKRSFSKICPLPSES